MPDELISVTSIKFNEKEQEDQGTLATSTATSFQRKASERWVSCEFLVLRYSLMESMVANNFFLVVETVMLY